MNLLKAAGAVSVMTLLSRITGLAREVISFAFFGAGPLMDAFQVAWRIPNFLRRLFAEGAFSQAFVPVFAEYKAQRGEGETRLLFERVAATLALVLLVVSIIGVIAAPALVWMMASGFEFGSEKFDVTVQMVRITFPYIFFISLVACCAGVLNTFASFKTPAFTPVLLNLSVIGTMLLLGPYLKTPILALAIGTMVGGVVQLAFQWPALKRIGMLPRLRLPPLKPLDPAVARILKLMVPALFGVSVAQISILINTQIASHLGNGAVSWLTMADRLMEFPSAMLGVAIGTVLLPSLARSHAMADTAQYSQLLDWGLRLTFMLCLPAALGLAMLALPLLSTLFQHGKILPNDVTQASYALVAYSVGLGGIILVKILAPGFYARQNIKTPVKIAIATLVITQLLNFAFVPYIGHAGLALSTGLGAVFNAAVLFYFIRKNGGYIPNAGWLKFIVKLCLALAVMGLLLWLCASDAKAWTGVTALQRGLKLTWVISAAAAVYFGTLYALGFRVKDFRRNG